MPTTKWCRTFIDVRQSALDLEPEDATDLTAQQFRYGGWVLAAKQPVLICCGLALASARGLTLPGFRSAEIRQTAISESAITIHALPKPAASNADDLFFNLAVPPLPRDKLELVSTVPSTRPRLRLVWHWQRVHRRLLAAGHQRQQRDGHSLLHHAHPIHWRTGGRAHFNIGRASAVSLPHQKVPLTQTHMLLLVPSCRGSTITWHQPPQHVVAANSAHFQRAPTGAMQPGTSYVLCETQC